MGHKDPWKIGMLIYLPVIFGPKRGALRGVDRKGWQTVGERLAKGWHKVGKGSAGFLAPSHFAIPKTPV